VERLKERLVGDEERRAEIGLLRIDLDNQRKIANIALENYSQLERKLTAHEKAAQLEEK
jgi:hypothetical protein